MKKIISALLAISMLFTVTSYCFAYNESGNSSAISIIVDNKTQAVKKPKKNVNWNKVAKYTVIGTAITTAVTLFGIFIGTYIKTHPSEGKLSESDCKMGNDLFNVSIKDGGNTVRVYREGLDYTGDEIKTRVTYVDTQTLSKREEKEFSDFYNNYPKATPEQIEAEREYLRGQEESDNSYSGITKAEKEQTDMFLREIAKRVGEKYRAKNITEKTSNEIFGLEELEYNSANAE